MNWFRPSGWLLDLARIFLAAVILAGPSPAEVENPKVSTVTKIIILRHAERQSDDKDTALSEAGQARARALVPLLESLKPDVVIVSELRRTRQTVAPFLEKSGMVPLVRRNEKCAELAAEILRVWPGKTVLLAWHRGPNVELARALGAKEPFSQWGPNTYDRYWIITVRADGAVTLEEKVQPPVVSTTSK